MPTRQERVRAVADEILDAFRCGALPAALAQVFIHRGDDRPASKWSWRNQLIAALRGHSDARGFRQWQKVGRSVKKGQKAFHILAPMTFRRRDDESEEDSEDRVLRGFRVVPVFGYGQTEGESLETPEEQRFLDRLPLVEVAKSWGLNVGLFSGGGRRYLGYYSRRPGAQAIALGVENLSTWAHEMIHAAEDRLGKLARKSQDPADEVVAELGGAVLLECLGETTASDRGGAWEYIQRVTEDRDAKPLKICFQLLERVAAAVEHILEAAEDLAVPVLEPCALGAADIAGSGTLSPDEQGQPESLPIAS